MEFLRGIFVFFVFLLITLFITAPLCGHMSTHFPSPPKAGLFVMIGLGVVFSFYGPFVLLGKVLAPFAGMRVSARFFSIALLGLSVFTGWGYLRIARQNLPWMKVGIPVIIAFQY